MENPTLSPKTVRAGWCWMAFQYLLLPSFLSGAAGLLPTGISDSTVNFLYHLSSFLGVSLIFFRFLKDSFGFAVRHWQRFSLVCALALIAYYSATWVVTRAIEALEPAFANRNDQAIFRLSREGLTVTALSVVFFAPVTEECLFRGLLFREPLSRSHWGAYALSALCFGLIHVMGYLGACTPLQLALSLLQYVPAGLILAWSCEKSQTLAAPIAVHAVINAISMIRIL